MGPRQSRVPLPDLRSLDLVLDLPAEQLQALRQRQKKELEQIEKNIANSERQLGDEKFLGKAPP